MSNPMMTNQASHLARENIVDPETTRLWKGRLLVMEKELARAKMENARLKLDMHQMEMEADKVKEEHKADMNEAMLGVLWDYADASKLANEQWEKGGELKAELQSKKRELWKTREELESKERDFGEAMRSDKALRLLTEKALESRKACINDDEVAALLPFPREGGLFCTGCGKRFRGVEFLAKHIETPGKCSRKRHKRLHPPEERELREPMYPPPLSPAFSPTSPQYSPSSPRYSPSSPGIYPF